jgi:hypothetical protein
MIVFVNLLKLFLLLRLKNTVTPITVPVVRTFFPNKLLYRAPNPLQFRKKNMIAQEPHQEIRYF